MSCRISEHSVANTYSGRHTRLSTGVRGMTGVRGLEEVKWLGLREAHCTSELHVHAEARSDGASR
jgi:hypothetical protein